MRRTIAGVGVFAVAFALVEASVVVYLRSLYNPEGFSFPLRPMSGAHMQLEVIREMATIVMLAAVGMLAGTARWQRMGYFLFAFGVWDIFYYIWLKVFLDWPGSLADWDVLFLIPIPWIAPVVAPVLIAFMMVGCGGGMVLRMEHGRHFRPTVLSWVLGIAATMIAISSFTFDVAATLHAAMPQPYSYGFLVVAMVLFAGSYATACAGPVNGHQAS